MVGRKDSDGFAAGVSTLAKSGAGGTAVSSLANRSASFQSGAAGASESAPPIVDKGHEPPVLGTDGGYQNPGYTGSAAGGGYTTTLTPTAYTPGGYEAPSYDYAQSERAVRSGLSGGVALGEENVPADVSPDEPGVLKW